MSTMPRQIHMGPLTYRVSTSLDDWKRLSPEDFDKDGDLRSWGYTHHTSGTILINPESHDVLQRLTLLHEIMHAAAFSAGQLYDRKRPEEDWVVMVSAPLLDAMKRTKGLTEYLRGAP
jgi:hypothetical protein